MSIYEYDQEAHMRMEREEWFEKGQKAAEAQIEAERKRAEEERKRANAAELQAKNTSLESARKLFQNGASYKLVRASITSLTDEELQKIYNETENK